MLNKRCSKQSQLKEKWEKRPKNIALWRWRRRSSCERRWSGCVWMNTRLRSNTSSFKSIWFGETSCVLCNLSVPVYLLLGDESVSLMKTRAHTHSHSNPSTTTHTWTVNGVTWHIIIAGLLAPSFFHTLTLDIWCSGVKHVALVADSVKHTHAYRYRHFVPQIHISTKITNPNNVRTEDGRANGNDYVCESGEKSHRVQSCTAFRSEIKLT